MRRKVDPFVLWLHGQVSIGFVLTHAREVLDWAADELESNKFRRDRRKARAAAFGSRNDNLLPQFVPREAQ